MPTKDKPNQNTAPQSVWAGRCINLNDIPHCHNACELLYVRRGEANVFCDKSAYAIQTGDGFFVHSGAVHYVKSTEGTVLDILVFDSEIIERLMANKYLASPLLTGDYALPLFFDEIKNVLKDKEYLYDIEAKCIITRLFIRILRGENLTDPQTPNKTSATFRKLLGDISERFDSYTFEDGAEYMDMSSAYFSRYFHTAVGMTFSQYLNQVRVKSAIELIGADSTLSMTEISARCGFATVRNFNRTFKDITGYAPTALPSYYTHSEKYYCPLLGDKADTALSGRLLTDEEPI